MKNELTYRLFINGEPIERYSEEERRKFAEEAADRLAETLNAFITAEEMETI